MSALFWVSFGLLWSLLVLIGIAVAILYYHFGQMYLNSREGRSAQGPELGQQAKPAISTIALSGDKISVQDGTARVLIFVAESCQLCAELRNDLNQQETLRRAPNGIVFVDDSTEYARTWVCIGTSASWKVVVDPHGKTAVQYGIDATPFCVGVDSAGVVQTKGTANTAEDVGNAYLTAANLLVVNDERNGSRS